MADEALDTENASAVLDEAHLGDIQGALGTIRVHDTSPRRSWRARLLTLLAVIGPGLIVMVGDNDAGGVATYAQAGQNYGLTLLWTLPLLIPILIVNQEMVVRLGAVTGVGHARLIKERFGKFWGAFSVGDLFVLNFLTIVTEFIGVSLALGYFGVSPYISVPLAVLGLVAMTATGSFRRWERFMLVFIVANFLVIPLAIYAHPHAGGVLHGFVVPGVRGGFNSTSVLLIIAIVGTTVAPWQLFFQQSNIVDKRITPRYINYERADTVIGSFVTVLGASLITITAAFAFAHTSLAGRFTNAAGVAHGLARYLGHGTGVLFAILLLNASIIGAAAVTLSTSYAFGDIFGMRHSLHRRLGEAKFFYASYAGIVALAGAIVLLPGAPLGLITTAVQALAGILLPSATVFLVLLCNDKGVLGPWVNRPWLNALATLIVSTLFVLSLILMATTVFPHVNVGALLVVLCAVLVVVLGASGLLYARALRGRAKPEAIPSYRRDTWRMPPLSLLERPPWSRGRTLTMYSMYGYVILSVALLLVKAVQLGIHK
ncbi:MAG TPA: NRAMP family divalent metal transporter [Acidimicrobiales bacterium]|nr:NRAMP family divalent metal transporter [Acidimicrobiales bacterium]